MRNLLLALFLFALAFPAIAMPAAPAESSQSAPQDCHGMPVEQPDGDTQHSEGSTRLHGCIGCVAPQGPTIALPEIPFLVFIVQQQTERDLTGTMQRPNIPPPRT